VSRIVIIFIQIIVLQVCTDDDGGDNGNDNNYNNNNNNIIIITEAKYSCLPIFFLCQSCSKLWGTIPPCSLDFLTEVGRRLGYATGVARETAFLFRRISVAIQRFNALLLHESFIVLDVEPDL